MLKRVTALLFILIFASSLFAQDGRYILRPDGEKIKISDNKELQEAIVEGLKTSNNGEKAVHHFHGPDMTTAQTPDTLGYSNQGSFNVNFGFFGQDVMFTWFVAPADMVIKGAGFTTSDQAGADAGASVSVRLLKLDNWTAEDFQAFSAASYVGAYPSEGDGFNNVAPLPEEATGDFVFTGDVSTLPWSENPADYDLWSDAGFGWPVVPEASDFTARQYQWVEMSNLGFEPEVEQGTIVAMWIKHEGVVLDDERIGFWSDNTIGYPCWKYYENGRSAPGGLGESDPGWHIRLYTWDFVLAVDLTGDRAPVIENVTQLGTTTSLEARTVSATITDDNPSGGPAGVASAELIYSVNSGADQVVAMSETEADVYAADIPGMTPGDTVTYSLRAVDVEGNETSALGSTYQIYKPTEGVDVLVVVNDGSARVGLLVPYYFDLIGVMQADYDVWSFGPVTAGLVENYSTIFEIQMVEAAPTADNRDVYAAWLAEGNKQFLLAGQEQLGYLYGYANMTFEAGDFEYDVLGVLDSYNDVTYAASGDEEQASVFYAQSGTLLGDSLSMLMSTLDPDTLLYDPFYNIGAANWLDQFDPRTDIGNEVFMHGVSLAGEEKPVGHNWTDGNGNKIVFMSYDPLNLVQAGGDDGAWVATSSSAPFHQAVQWFGLDVVSVRDITDQVPNQFTLEQNYPNPFNPTTKFNYAIAKPADVKVKIFDVLGREIATLVNEFQKSGKYEVTWNGLNNNGQKVTSGTYIYQLQAGDVVQTKKMMLLK